MINRVNLMDKITNKQIDSATMNALREFREKVSVRSNFQA